MKGPLTASAIFHAVIITLCIIGIPYLHRDMPVLSEPLSVELARPDELTRTNKPSARVLPHPRPQQLEKPPPTPPKAADPEKPEVKVTPSVKPPDELALPDKKLKKPVAPPKPPEKKQPPKDKTSEQKPDFQSVLRNLMPAPPLPAANDSPDKADKPAPPVPLSQQLTMSETDALRKQLGECWSLMAGARYAENLVVDVKLVMNPDRTVRDAEVLDQLRYAADSYFRAAADSALRAVRNPHCNPLELPPDKYQGWKVFTVTFDPKEML